MSITNIPRHISTRVLFIIARLLSLSHPSFVSERVATTAIIERKLRTADALGVLRAAGYKSSINIVPEIIAPNVIVVAVLSSSLDFGLGLSMSMFAILMD